MSTGAISILASFQFQSGSIKRPPQPKNIPNSEKFQFQSGSIKSYNIVGGRKNKFTYFNSKVVRLKEINCLVS